MRVTSRRKAIAFFVTLSSCVIAAAIALNISWIVINWRELGTLILGVIFFGIVISGLVLNTIFLVREIRRNEQQDSFLHAVTHELKTPLTSIRLYLQTLQSRNVDEQQRAEFYRVMLADSDRLLGTVEQVLHAAELGHRKNKLEEIVDMETLTRECLQEARTRHHLSAEALRMLVEASEGGAKVIGSREELRSAVSNVLENAIEQYTYTGVVRKRAGSRHGTAWPCTVFPCKDGYIGMCCTQIKEVRGAVLLAEDYELADDPVLHNQFERRARADELEPRLVAGYMKYGKSELFHKGQALGCPVAMTSDARDLVNDPHLNEVGFFAEFDHPVIGKFKEIAAPIYFTATPGVMRSAAPLLGQHTAEVLHSLGTGEADLSFLRADGVI